MDKSEIFILIAVILFLAFRLYQKYGKKDRNTPGNKASASILTSSSKEEEYEPYSGK
jgi:hypothetical protein